MKAKNDRVDNVDPQAENNSLILSRKNQRFGLSSHDLLDVEKSADAAARYISDSLAQFSDDPMKEALASEIMEAHAGQGNAIRKRDEVHKMAQANKAFAHFRW